MQVLKSSALLLPCKSMSWRQLLWMSLTAKLAQGFCGQHKMDGKLESGCFKTLSLPNSFC